MSEDHTGHITFDDGAMVAVCSLCGILIDFNGDVPVKVGGDKRANHSFSKLVEIKLVKVGQGSEA
jgi:hypothetical protein